MAGKTRPRNDLLSTNSLTPFELSTAAVVYFWGGTAPGPLLTSHLLLFLLLLV